MSQIFHKSCYTSRSAGYKYRTLSTNTGERKRRDSKEDTTFGRKFNELQREITSRIIKEVDETKKARQYIQEKFEQVEGKINNMLDVKNEIVSLREGLRVAENTLVDVMEKVDKIENFMGLSENCSLRTRRSYYCEPRPIVDYKEMVNSLNIQVIRE